MSGSSASYSINGLIGNVTLLVLRFKRRVPINVVKGDEEFRNPIMMVFLLEKT